MEIAKKNQLEHIGNLLYVISDQMKDLATVDTIGWLWSYGEIVEDISRHIREEIKD